LRVAPGEVLPDPEFDRLIAAREILNTAEFSGPLAVSFAANSTDTVHPPSNPGDPPISHAQSWPWASVTKQVLAVLVMQEVEAGRIALDNPAQDYLPALDGQAPSPTVRQLLQHRSGLRNPDDSPADANGVPAFYADGPTGIDWCLAERAAPSEGWQYNNCDYIVLGALLEQVTGQTVESLIADRIGGPARWEGTSLLAAGEARDFAGQDAAYASRIARYGSSAALVGPLEDILRFDRALLDGTLLSAESRDMLWEGDPALGYMALGQWVFEAPLAGCDAPVRIVERRGGIGKYGVRNIILPDRGIAIVLTTDQDGFDFGEIWMGSGVMHDVLAAVACG
jgi:CubicO group peptidase (beta-lactamase class C family)